MYHYGMNSKVRTPLKHKTVTVSLKPRGRGAKVFTFDVDYTNQLGPDMFEPQVVRLHVGDQRVDVSDLLSDEFWGGIELALPDAVQAAAGAAAAEVA